MAHVEIFTAQGTKPLAQLMKMSCPRLVKREYDKGCKSNVLVLEGTTPTQCNVQFTPALGVLSTTPVLMLQVQVPSGDVLIEIAYVDNANTKRRVTFSNSVKGIVVDPFHTRIPLASLPRSQWLNVFIHMGTLLERSGGFRSLERLTLGPCLKARRIYALREVPRGVGDQPRGSEFPPGVPECETFVIAQVQELTPTPKRPAVPGSDQPSTAGAKEKPKALVAFGHRVIPTSPGVVSARSEETFPPCPPESIATTSSSAAQTPRDAGLIPASSVQSSPDIRIAEDFGDDVPCEPQTEPKSAVQSPVKANTLGKPYDPNRYADVAEDSSLLNTSLKPIVPSPSKAPPNGVIRNSVVQKSTTRSPHAKGTSLYEWEGKPTVPSPFKAPSGRIRNSVQSTETTSSGQEGDSRLLGNLREEIHDSVCMLQHPPVPVLDDSMLLDPQEHKAAVVRSVSEEPVSITSSMSLAQALIRRSAQDKSMSNPMVAPDTFVVQYDDPCGVEVEDEREAPGEDVQAPTGGGEKEEAEGSPSAMVPMQPTSQPQSRYTATDQNESPTNAFPPPLIEESDATEDIVPPSTTSEESHDEDDQEPFPGESYDYDDEREENPSINGTHESIDIPHQMNVARHLNFSADTTAGSVEVAAGVVRALNYSENSSMLLPGINQPHHHQNDSDVTQSRIFDHILGMYFNTRTNAYMMEE